MRDPFWKWLGASIAVVAIVLTLMVLALLGHGAVIAYPLQILFQLLPLLLYLVLPVVLIICRVALGGGDAGRTARHPQGSRRDCCGRRERASAALKHETRTSGEVMNLQARKSDASDEATPAQ